jgi:hypothetical protein
VNLEKHVKSSVEEVMLADSSEVPGRARSPHVVGHYIKEKKLQYEGGHRDVIRPAPVLVRLEGVSTDRTTRERLERFIREMNRECRVAHAPLRLRIV